VFPVRTRLQPAGVQQRHTAANDNQARARSQMIYRLTRDGTTSGGSSATAPLEPFL